MIATIKKPVNPVNKKSANAAFRSAGSWNSINWDYHRTIVKKLQLRIAKATRERKFRKVKTCNGSLPDSLFAKLLAVRNVMKPATNKKGGL